MWLCACARRCVWSCISKILTSLRRLKASVRAMSNIPMPWANSLSRCSRKCWGNKVWGETLQSLEGDRIGCHYWFLWRRNKNEGQTGASNNKKITNIKVLVSFTYNTERHNISLNLIYHNLFVNRDSTNSTNGQMGSRPVFAANCHIILVWNVTYWLRELKYILFSLYLTLTDNHSV